MKIKLQFFFINCKKNNLYLLVVILFLFANTTSYAQTAKLEIATIKELKTKISSTSFLHTIPTGLYIVGTIGIHSNAAFATQSTTTHLVNTKIEGTNTLVLNNTNYNIIYLTYKIKT